MFARFISGLFQKIADKCLVKSILVESRTDAILLKAIGEKANDISRKLAKKWERS